MRKAVALISGGLDSMLAAKLMLEQGIHVEGLNFFTGFCVEGHTHAIRRKDRSKKKRNNALWVAEELGIKLHIIDVVEDYKEVVINPKHGYGKHLNPCLDCKVFMVSRAKEWMLEQGFDFIITGEVLGQRPMSQNKRAMPIVAKCSDTESLLVRPLSAQYLAPTLPEREGWVDREKMLGITGRGRSTQIDLARQFDIKDYAQPAGGCCFLTNPEYSNKLTDLWQHRGSKRYELDDILLLKVGRHLRTNDRFKLIIGREEGENNYLEGYRRQFIHILSTSHNGPLVLLEGEPNEDDLVLAARIAARFTAGRDEPCVALTVQHPGGRSDKIEVNPMIKEDILEEWYL